jgi:KaiC/GvpD/RAD55 family RecA-like ATPase
MTRTIPVDIDGLNLVLGGGVPVLKRHPDYDESAILLVRGPPGSGKTIFGVQLAGSLARKLGCDVAYGCIELLPSELAAQHAGIKWADVSERVIIAPFTKQGPKGEECRIFAEMLDLGSSREEVAKLGDAIERVLAAIERAGGQSRVLVIDSLSDGYNLGSSAPRELADALCKMAAQRGMILILLEEIVESKPSVWSFAADCVIELSLQREEDTAALTLVRRLAVSKNRFSASEPGPHRFTITKNEGIHILPQPTAYLASWAQALVLPRVNPQQAQPQSWGQWLTKVPVDWPPFGDCVTAIYGSEAQDIFAVASKLGTTAKSGRIAHGFDIFIDFQRDDGLLDMSLINASDSVVIGSGSPFTTGAWLIATATAATREILSKGKTIRRVLIGDLQSLRTFCNAAGARQALTVLVLVLRKAHVPVILFETSVPRTIERIADHIVGVTQEEIATPAPPILDVADVAIEIIKRPIGMQYLTKPNVFMTHLRTGRVLSWESGGSGSPAGDPRSR